MNRQHYDISTGADESPWGLLVVVLLVLVACLGSYRLGEISGAIEANTAQKCEAVADGE